MALDWKTVKAEHITQACELVASGEAAPRASAKGIFVLRAGHRLPAKHVLRIAYCIAHALPLDSQIKFSSGDSMANRLSALGFDVEHVKSDRAKV